MERFNELLYNLFSSEILNLNIGYEINKCSLQKMLDIINIIDCWGQGILSTDEKNKLLEIYKYE